MANPYTPAFGIVPPYLAGREYLVSEITGSLDNGPGDPSRTSILIGARGSGKTATLCYLAQQAQQRGWLAVQVTAVPGMLEDIIQQAQRASAHLVASEDKRLKGVSLSVAGIGGSATWETPSQAQLNWRSRMTDLLEALEPLETGILITVDEVDPALDQMVELVCAYQHLLSEGRRVALAMAGLPHRAASLINGKSVSFLRRAARKELGRIPDFEVENAFRVSSRMGGKAFAEDAIALAVRETAGFPYMLQLIGFRAFAAAGDEPIIQACHVQEGARLAGEDMRSRVLRATLDELSDGDLAYLSAMEQDESRSLPGDIARRLACSASSASNRKRRLMDLGVIQMATRTHIEFALPLLREYLPEYIEQNE